MTLFNLTLDHWAISEETTIITVIIQIICTILTLILIISRIYHIYKGFDQIKSNWKFALLRFLQLFMMIFSFFYMFCWIWNYLHSHLSSNSIGCRAWWRLVVILFMFTRIILFAFVMLRTSLLFENTFCELSLKISIPIVIINTLINSILPVIWYDSEGFNPFPNKGFCFRWLGDVAVALTASNHVCNGITSIAAVVIFYWKARSVQKCVAGLQKDNKMNDGLRELNASFMKHIKLGIISVAGTILMFFVQDFLTVLLGISFTLDQTVNNVLTFLMFKEYDIIYQYLSCKSKQQIINNQPNVVNLASIAIGDKPQSSESTAAEIASTSSTDIKAARSNVVAVIH